MTLYEILGLMAVSAGTGAAMAVQPKDFAFYCGCIAAIIAGALAFWACRRIALIARMFRGQAGARLEFFLMLYYVVTVIVCFAAPFLVGSGVPDLMHRWI